MLFLLFFRVSLSTADNPADEKILLEATSTDDTLGIEAENASMSDCGSVTALAVGLAAAACAANAATNVTPISAPVTPQGSGSSLHHGKTVDFSGVSEATELAPRRAVTDVERRRQSLAQRRQSNVQLVSSVSGRRTSTTLIPLTPAQIHLIRALWRQIYVSKGPTVIGQTIIHRLFFKMPKTKDQFRRCPLPRGFPNHDSFSKAHSKAMAELIDAVVENLDNLEAISEKLERVGRMHAQVLRGELSSKLWNTVAETFIDCTLEWGDKRCRSETVRKAWALITAFMIERIKSGHLEQRKHMLSMRATIAALERTELNSSGSMRVNT
uniref:GLOBIN domain-containing protein n=1 Tax=Panagrellus redivivus TaxID=6233 RepID=A0A7E4UT98_PANRE